jgi:hypothetical protein
VTSNKRETSSASIKKCLNLPAERRNGKERGRQTYDTELSMRRQTVYEETNGDVPVAQGFGTTVLRRLSTHSLVQQHWQYPDLLILQAVCSRMLGVSSMRAAHVLVGLGSGSIETRSGTIVVEPRGCCRAWTWRCDLYGICAESRRMLRRSRGCHCPLLRLTDDLTCMPAVNTRALS